MKKVIIVTGPRKTLKTTVCRKLESDLGIMVYNFDDLKKIIIGLDREGYIEKDNYYRLITTNLIKKLIVDTLAVHEHVILEMTYKESLYTQLMKLCKNNQFELLTIFMTGEPEEIYERYVEKATYDVQNGEEAMVMNELDFMDTMIPISDQFDQSHILTVDTTSFDDQDYTILMHQVIDQLEWKINNPLL